jgi:hypothetical protein
LRLALDPVLLTVMKPEEDPRVTDLRRYRKEREQAKRRPPQRPAGESFLGSNPRAGVILVVVILVIAALYAIPRFL